MRQLHLLHLEDDINDARLIRAQLEGGGLDCLITRVETRADFVAILEQGRVDVVISDYALPSFDGMAALQLVRAKWPLLPFVLVTGSLGEEVAVEALKSGATDYVLKGRLARLTPAVKRALVDVERLKEQRQAEAELRWKTALFEAQVDASIDGILVVDEEGRKIVQNGRMAEIWKLPPAIIDDPRSEPELEFVLEQLCDPGAFVEKVRRLYASPHKVSRDEIERKDGSVLDRYSAPVRDKHGRYYGRIWVFRDITERKQAEAQLRKLSLAVEQSPVIVVITDLRGNIEYVNPKFTEVTGYTFEEAAGQNVRLLKSGTQPAALYEDLWRTLASGRSWRGEFHNKKKNGELYWERASISPIMSKRRGITHFLAIKEDITEHRQLEAQFRQAQKMDAVGRLAAGVAHDFNNLLTVILGYSDILLAGTLMNEGLQDSVIEIKKAGEQAARLTRQLLAFSRQQVLEPQELDLNAVVADCGRMLHRLVGEDIDLKVVLEPGGKRVRVDPVQLEQALINMVVNSRDAIAQFGKITISTGMVVLDADYCRRHPQARPGPYALLTVADTGCGMDEATLGRIFEPFFTTKDLGKGTGLGLAMVFGFIQQSGGHVTVTSAPGEGSSFGIYLPALEAVPAERIVAPVIEPPRSGRETILLVEDEGGVRMMVRLILKSRGYTVLEAERGDQAIQVAEGHGSRIHLLISDMVMPGMGGAELARQMRHLKPDIKVLLMSGYSGDVLNRHGGLPEESFFLQKPFAVPLLESKVREILNS